MGSKTNHSENKILDCLYRGQSITVDGKTLSWSAAPNWHIGLGVADFFHAVSQVLALNATVFVETDALGWKLYKVTTAGTTAASKPSYPGANNEAITDGTAVLTEQYDALEAGTAFVEPVSADYARVAVLSSLANWSGTQGPGTTVASTGTDGTIENNNPITYPDAATAGYGKVGMFGFFDAATGGNLFRKAFMTSPVDIGLGAANISFANNQLTNQEDN